MQDINCTVIGAGGFIGSHLCEALHAQGFQVTAFDRKGARYLDLLQSSGLRVITGDFLDSEAVGQALKNSAIVFHLVSTTVPQNSNDNPAFDVNTNVSGTLNLLETARQAGVKKIVFASSGGTVYGIPLETPIRESHPTNPITSYGISKLAIEKYLYLYRYLHGLDYCILRIANAYGERQLPAGSQGVISAFLSEALNQQNLVIWGDGSVVRDYVYVKDVADALVRGALYPGEEKIFNIGSGKGYSIHEVANVIQGIVRGPSRLKYTPARPFDVPVNVLNIELARERLGWQPVTGLDEGIFRSFQWMQKEPRLRRH